MPEQSDSDRRVVRRYGHHQTPPPPSKGTVADLLDWLGEHDLDPTAVTIYGGLGLSWETPETDAEVAARAASAQRADERQRDFVRRKAEELFGVVIRPGGSDQ